MKFDFKKFFNLYAIGTSGVLLTMLIIVIIINLFHKPFKLELGILELILIITPSLLYAIISSVSFDKDNRDDILDNL